MQRLRNYLTEFKREAVELANQPGVTLKHFAKELGINPNQIGRWRRELAGDKSKAFPVQGRSRD